MKPQITIGLIDPNQLMRQGLLSLLKTQNHIQPLLNAENSMQMLNGLEGNCPDIILLGSEIPGSHDLKTVQTLAQNYPLAKIIVLTGYLNDAFVLEALSFGVKAILAKTTSITKLVEAIEAVYNKGFFYGSEITEVVEAQIVELENDLSIVRITKRESEILKLLISDKTSNEIAKTLYISKRTLEGHRQRLMKRTGSKDVEALKKWAASNVSFSH